jgi:hypothetical protein
MDEFIDNVFKFWNDVWFCNREDDNGNYIDPFNVWPIGSHFWYTQNEKYTLKIKEQKHKTD